LAAVAGWDRGAISMHAASFGCIGNVTADLSILCKSLTESRSLAMHLILQVNSF
jgi:hypothetical protein